MRADQVPVCQPGSRQCGQQGEKYAVTGSTHEDGDDQDRRESTGTVDEDGFLVESHDIRVSAQRFCGSLQEDTLAHNLRLRYFAYV